MLMICENNNVLLKCFFGITGSVIFIEHTFGLLLMRITTIIKLQLVSLIDMIYKRNKL